jgi:RPC5 protein
LERRQERKRLLTKSVLQDLSNSNSEDPIIASYDIFITDADIRRFLLQYPDRQSAEPYNHSTHQKPTELRLKPETGLVEVDIPIDTELTYDKRKGLRYGNALRKSHVIQEGGTHGLAGGFNAGAAGCRIKSEDEMVGEGGLGVGDDGDEAYAGVMGSDDEDRKVDVIMGKLTLGGRIKPPVDGDPVYMLGAFRESRLTPRISFYIRLPLPPTLSD